MRRIKNQMSISETAKRLEVCEATIYNYINRGILLKEPEKKRGKRGRGRPRTMINTSSIIRHQMRRYGIWWR